MVEEEVLTRWVHDDGMEIVCQGFLMDCYCFDFKANLLCSSRLVCVVEIGGSMMGFAVLE